MARFRYLGGALALVIASCDGRAGNPEVADITSPSAAVAVTGSSSIAVPLLVHAGPASFDRPASALMDRRDPTFPEPLVDPDELLPGGPGPDGITPIDKPNFVTVPEIDFLEPQDAVIVLEHRGEARAFPVDVVIWHEIVNTEVGGDPVTVSYCPLCNSAVAYRRTHPDGTIMDFGTSGLLFNDSLVMYDRQTASLWTHFDGLSVIGLMTGNQLELLPMATVSFSDFSQAHPDGLVLSRDTGMQRAYGRNPYFAYDTGGGLAINGIPARTKVILIRGDQAIALVHEHLFEQRVVTMSLDGRDLVALLERGTATPLQIEEVSYGRDVGATGVFVPEVDGKQLTFDAIVEDEGGGFRDAQTGSTWDVLGHAVDGPLRGASLEPVEHVDTFWFAIAAFRPDAAIVGADASGSGD